MALARELFVPYAISKSEITKFMIWKNYFLVCFIIMFFYLTVNAVGGVQSTINKEGGLGLASSAVAYSVFGLSALVIPQLLIKKIKFKWTMTLGLALQFFYVGFNAYPKWYTYLPGLLFK